MSNGYAAYGSDPNTGTHSLGVLKRVWIISVVFTIVYFIVAIISADDNHKANSGSEGAGFSAIWSCFLLFICVLGITFLVVRGRASPIFVGITIGFTALLAQLFFVLMVVFFVLGQSAGTDYDVGPTDKAMGSFCLFNSIIFGGITYLVFVNRHAIIVDPLANDSTHDDHPLTGGVSSSSTPPSNQSSPSKYSFKNLMQGHDASKLVPDSVHKDDDIEEISLEETV